MYAFWNCWQENESFDNILQHDAQEFLNYLLNHIGDTLKNDTKKNANAQSTWVQDLFQVRLVLEVKF